MYSNNVVGFSSHSLLYVKLSIPISVCARIPVGFHSAPRADEGQEGWEGGGGERDKRPGMAEEELLPHYASLTGAWELDLSRFDRRDKYYVDNVSNLFINEVYNCLFLYFRRVII